MRLCRWEQQARLEQQTSKVGADVRAALASWGRGQRVLGGVALLGCQPPGCPKPVDAILVLPRGVLVVVGVDLPEPAMRLDAPLGAEWKTDGWPLVRGDGAVNPAVEAMAAASAVLKRLELPRAEPLPVGTVIAVGPYVAKVNQPTADLVRGVRILHPEPTTLLAAVRELAVHPGRYPVQAAQTLLAALAPDQAPLDPTALAEEGFAERGAASTAVISRVTADKTEGETDEREPTRVMTPTGGTRGKPPRWLPLGAAGLVVLLLVVGIVVALLSTGDGGTGPGQRTGGAPQANINANGMSFTPKGSTTDTACAAHAYGDLRSALETAGCTRLVRARFEVDTKGGRAAVLVADLTLANQNNAASVRNAAQTPGGGAISDAAVEGAGWPGGAKPSFASAAYVATVNGTEVRIVQAAWLDRASAANDPDLAAVAAAAVGLPR